MFTDDDTSWMQHAIRLAQTAAFHHEVPVGAVLVRDHAILGEGYNSPIHHHDASAHAEMLALRHAGKNIQNYRLVDTTLYVTLEPCAMCVGALIHARVKRLVFGAFDPKSGAVQSIVHLLDEKKLNHRVEYQGGLLADQCGQLLTEFFQARR